MVTKTQLGASIGASEWVAHLGGEQVLSAEGDYYPGLDIGQYRFPERPDRFTAPPLARHYISITLDGSTEVERNLSGDRDTAQFTPGHSLIMSAGQPNAWRWDRPTEEVHFYLCPELLRDMAASIGLTDVELIDRFGFSDPELQRLARALLTELRAPDIGSRLWVESLTNVLGLHILRHHCRSGRIHLDPAGLTSAQIRRVEDFVTSNLGENISLAEMAGVAGVSRFHFAHMFKRSMGMPPHRWLVERRLDRAKELLRSTDRSVTEIAFEVGYHSQSHFGLVFRRATGMTPRAWRKG